MRFRAVISAPEIPSFCGISGNLAPSTRKSPAIAIVQFWLAKPNDCVKGGVVILAGDSIVEWSGRTFRACSLLLLVHTGSQPAFQSHCQRDTQIILGRHACRTKQPPKMLDSMRKWYKNAKKDPKHDPKRLRKIQKPLSCCLNSLTGTFLKIGHHPKICTKFNFCTATIGMGDQAEKHVFN